MYVCVTTIKGLHTSLYQKKDDIFHGPGALVCHVGTVGRRVLLKVLDDLQRYSALEQVMLRQRVLSRGLGGADCDVINLRHSGHTCTLPQMHKLARQKHTPHTHAIRDQTQNRMHVYLTSFGEIIFELYMSPACSLPATPRVTDAASATDCAALGEDAFSDIGSCVDGKGLRGSESSGWDGAHGKRRGFSPGAAARHSQPATVHTDFFKFYFAKSFFLEKVIQFLVNFF